MSEQPPWLVEEWKAAVRDVGLAEDCVRLLPIADLPNDVAPRAKLYLAGQAVPPYPDVALSADWYHAAAQTDEHRLALFRDLDPDDPVERALLAGLMRHELEHVRHAETLGPELLHKLEELVEDVVVLVAGPPPLGDALYRRKPSEQDANSAASQYLRKGRHAWAVEALRARPAVAELVTSRVGAGSPKTLIPRSMGFCLMFREQIERTWGSGAWRVRVEALGSSTLACWETLVRAADEFVGAGGDPGIAWDTKPPTI